MEQNQGENKREHYRIVYPISCRPKLVLNKKEYEVADISEKGIRLVHSETCALKPGSEVRAEIIFHNGQSVDVECRVLRINETDVVLILLQGLPFSIITEEQRYIKKNFPDLTK